MFIPDIPYNGLSSQGCISLHEKFLSPSSDYMALERDSAILHELVHQWFGNLVAIKWWNDLWIMESMAVYMTYRGLTNDDIIQGDKMLNYAGFKFWAIKLDSIAEKSRSLTQRVKNTE